MLHSKITNLYVAKHKVAYIVNKQLKQHYIWSS